MCFYFLRFLQVKPVPSMTTNATPTITSSTIVPIAPESIDEITARWNAFIAETSFKANFRSIVICVLAVLSLVVVWQPYLFAVCYLLTSVVTLCRLHRLSSSYRRFTNVLYFIFYRLICYFKCLHLPCSIL